MYFYYDYFLNVDHLQGFLLVDQDENDVFVVIFRYCQTWTEYVNIFFDPSYESF